MNFTLLTGEVATQKSTLKSEDIKYLREILADTWLYLDSHIAKETGYPTDTQKPGGTTNTTNIGLYLISLCSAYKIGLCDAQHVIARTGKIISSLKKYKTKLGFLPNWLSVDGDFTTKPGTSAISDFNKLVAGLIFFRQTMPALRKPVDEFLSQIDWHWIYDVENEQTYWGYNLLNDKTVGKGTFWLSSDCRFAVFMMIANGTLPANHWHKLVRGNIVTDFGMRINSPGYEFGALFMHAMDGILLDDLACQAGKSTGNLGWDQIQKANKLGLPVWGWSNCNNPNKNPAGYTEGGFIPEHIITPHASALFLSYYPKKVVANLRKLDELGLRKHPSGKIINWGFRDSIDVKSGKIDPYYTHRH